MSLCSTKRTYYSCSMYLISHSYVLELPIREQVIRCNEVFRIFCDRAENQAQSTKVWKSPVTWLNDIAEKLSVQRGYKPYPLLDTQHYSIHERIHESSSLVHLHLAWKGSVEIVSAQWKDFICWRGQTMSTSTDLSHTICYINKSQPSNLFPLL